MSRKTTGFALLVVTVLALLDYFQTNARLYEP
jgi:hypothetical protein